MTEIKIPSIKGKKSVLPDKPLCPWCKKNKVFEPHSFAFIQGGALLMNRKEEFGSSSPDLDAFFTIGWHGAHIDEGGLGQDSNIDINIEIAKEVIGGSFSFYFCSTNCLRSFLNAYLDELESKVKSSKKGNE